MSKPDYPFTGAPVKDDWQAVAILQSEKLETALAELKSANEFIALLQAEIVKLKSPATDPGQS